jgi:hypothetical protein
LSKKTRLRKLINDPKHWRARANEMRAIAAQVTHTKIKATTSGAADAYDKIAQLEEARAAAAGRPHAMPNNSK